MKLKQNIHSWKEKAIDFFHIEKSIPVDINCGVRCRTVHIKFWRKPTCYIFTLFILLKIQFF